MRKRLLAALLAFALMAAMVPETFAVDSGSITDISGHWAESSIKWALENKVFVGTGNTTFEPDSVMTRGMFVTALGRMADVNRENYQNTTVLFQDVPTNAYYAPYINWAVRYGIASGVADGLFAPEELITREQMAVFMVRYASIYNYQMVKVGEAATDTFADADSISSYAMDSVGTVCKVGIFNGEEQTDGIYFNPAGNVTRAECAVALQRLKASLQPYEGRVIVNPVGLRINGDTSSLTVGQWICLESKIVPENASNQTITWVSMDTSVATVNLSGKVTAIGEGIVTIYAYTWNGMMDSYTITCSKEASTVSNAETYNVVNTEASAETYEQKCTRAFGTVVSNPRRYYQTSTEALSHMVTITVPVWDFADSSRITKTTKYLTLQVNENMADIYTAIFEEIYNGSEQFPIKEIGCYRWEPGSEHMPGLAVDINPNENYECTLDGTATTGSYWKPGEDPYSIPADGDVVNAFRKYGFGWGGNWNTKKDYMHFSYFST